MQITFNIILFPDFETLDVFGPVEVFGKVENWSMQYYSMQGGLISNQDNLRIETATIDKFNPEGINVLFIPGGLDTRREIDNNEFIKRIKFLAEYCQYVFTVCTGSALLAKTGLMNGKEATSNKRAFDWVMDSSDKVIWKRQARWVIDDKYYTSSGISAGIDMALEFVSNVKGIDEAREIAHRIEYNWQEDKDVDNFYNQ